MLKALILAIALLSAPALHADTVKKQNAAEKSPQKSIEFKLRVNAEFIKAAKKIVEESGAQDAKALLKMAEAAAEEGFRHYKEGELEFASEDIGEATQIAVHAIILSRNREDQSIRDFIMREEMLLSAKRDHERKEEMIKKGLAEVDIFIKTADRLLKQKDDPSARGKLSETRDLYASSKGKLSNGDYDGALSEINRAYRLATGTVKEIKRSQGDIITFPKANLTDEREVLAYEVKKNEAYVFFASQVIKDESGDTGALLKQGLSAKEEALKAIDAGEGPKAIERLKASTDLLIRAIKSSGARD